MMVMGSEVPTMSHRKVRQIAGQKGGKSRSRKKRAAGAANLNLARIARWAKKEVSKT